MLVDDFGVRGVVFGKFFEDDVDCGKEEFVGDWFGVGEIGCELVLCEFEFFVECGYVV